MCQDKSACIEPTKICDGVFDCKDYSDELGCVDPRGCATAGKFSCNPNLCIDYGLACDGHEDCPDGKDELNCTCKDIEFTCFDGQCINKTLRCDSFKDCFDGSDEWSCVIIDERDIVLQIRPGTNKHGILCADGNFTINDAHEICQFIGMENAIGYSQVEVELENGTEWIDKLSFWQKYNQGHLSWNLKSNDTNENKFLQNEIYCEDNLAQTVTCKKFKCSSFYEKNSPTNLKIGTPKEVESMVKLSSINYSSVKEKETIECMAQIIFPTWLLSSYTCLEKLVNNGNITSIQLHLNASLELGRKVKKIVLNPHSSKYRSLYVRNYDLGLVELTKPIEFTNKSADAICLPTKDIDSDITCFLTKFNDLEPAAFLVLDREKCNENKHYNNTIFKDNICTIRQSEIEDEKIALSKSLSVKRESKSISYIFASGSPLICLGSDSKWFLAGFLNYIDERDNLEHPTIFSNVFSMKDFIRKVTGINDN